MSLFISKLKKIKIFFNFILLSDSDLCVNRNNYESFEYFLRHGLEATEKREKIAHALNTEKKFERNELKENENT